MRERLPDWITMGKTTMDFFKWLESGRECIKNFSDASFVKGTIQKKLEEEVTELGKNRINDNWDQLILKSGCTREQLIPVISREQICMKMMKLGLKQPKQSSAILDYIKKRH